MKRGPILLLLLVVVSIAYAQPDPGWDPGDTYQITGTTYYVSTTGDDSNDGLTAQDAFATIKHAATVVQAGDGVVVEDGTYTECEIVVTSSGTGSQPIIFKARNRKQATIARASECAYYDTGDPPAILRFDGSHGAYTIWDGFVIDGVDAGGHFNGAVGAYLENTAHNVYINHFEMLNNWNGIMAMSGERLIVRNSDIHNMRNTVRVENFINTLFEDNRFWSGYSGNSDGIIAERGGTGIVVRRCESWDHSDAGFDIKPDDAILDSCYAHHNTNNGFKLWSNAVLTNCISFKNGDAGYQLGGSYGTPKLINSIAISNGRAGLRPSSDVSRATQTLVSNSIFFSDGSGSSPRLVRFACDEMYIDDHNLYYATNPGLVAFYGLPGGDITVANLASSSYLGQDSLVENPMFVNHNSDWHLQESSPAIDAGSDNADVPDHDFEGNSRPLGVTNDIGAYESSYSTDPCEKDGDTYRDVSCGGDDCDDLNRMVHPGATEICQNSVDEDCNNQDLQCSQCPLGPVPSTGCICDGAPRYTGQCCQEGWYTSCPGQCPDGAISQDCYCQGSLRSSGYCCNNVFLTQVNCSSSSQCDDSNPSTADTCVNAGQCSSYCSHALPGQCSDGQITVTCACGGSYYSAGYCCNNVFSSSVACSSDTDCDDYNSTTTDACINPSTCNARCDHVVLPCTNCCSNGRVLWACYCGSLRVTSGYCCDSQVFTPCIDNSDCNDHDAGTLDECKDGGTCDARCENTPITACNGGDGYCPVSCTYSSDPDCELTCGNDMPDAGETCSNCPSDVRCGLGYRCCEDTCISICTSDADCPVAEKCIDPGQCSAHCGYVQCVDNDNDGFNESYCGPWDCNDHNAEIHPGAKEICYNNKDEDCDGKDSHCVMNFLRIDAPQLVGEGQEFKITVKDRSGKLIGGASVAYGTQSVKTDSKGLASLLGELGVTSLSVSKESYEDTTASFEVRAKRDSLMVMVPPSVANGDNFIATIKNQLGESVAGAEVSYGSHKEITDDQGQVMFTAEADVPVLSASKPGYLSAQKEVLYTDSIESSFSFPKIDIIWIILIVSIAAAIFLYKRRSPPQKKQEGPKTLRPMGPV